jgi:hypothetical protein
MVVVVVVAVVVVAVEDGWESEGKAVDRRAVV